MVSSSSSSVCRRSLNQTSTPICVADWAVTDIWACLVTVGLVKYHRAFLWPTPYGLAYNYTIAAFSQSLHNRRIRDSFHNQSAHAADLHELPVLGERFESQQIHTACKQCDCERSLVDLRSLLPIADHCCRTEHCQTSKHG